MTRRPSIDREDRRGLRRFMRAVVLKMRERGLEGSTDLPPGVLEEVVAEFGGTAQARRFAQITEHTSETTRHDRCGRSVESFSRKNGPTA
jgi:hypothetical protein